MIIFYSCSLLCLNKHHFWLCSFISWCCWHCWHFLFQDERNVKWWWRYCFSHLSSLRKLKTSKKIYFYLYFSWTKETNKLAKLKYWNGWGELEKCWSQQAIFNLQRPKSWFLKLCNFVSFFLAAFKLKVQSLKLIAGVGFPCFRWKMLFLVLTNKTCDKQSPKVLIDAKKTGLLTLLWKQQFFVGNIFWITCFYIRSGLDVCVLFL